MWLSSCIVLAPFSGERLSLLLPLSLRTRLRRRLERLQKHGVAPLFVAFFYIWKLLVCHLQNSTQIRNYARPILLQGEIDLTPFNHVFVCVRMQGSGGAQAND